MPSPRSGVLHLGPVPLHAYGLMLAIGILVAATVAERRWVARGHDAADFGRLVVPIVLGGIVGARVYHLFTGYDWAANGFAGAIRIWEGGLSIWGAVAGGAVVAVVLARRRALPVADLLDAAAPGVVLAQAIGRWGNWFNQELFGRPSTLPWAVEIDPAHRPAGYGQYETFQPTFLYESLWCLLVFGLLVWGERRFRFRPGQTFAAYVALYTFGRIGFEALRIDDATRLLGIRFNLLLTIVLCIVGTTAFVILGRRPRPAASEPDAGPGASDPASTPVDP
ncbi:MAG: prolipoprotein diacylglyceryl transferase [Actinomycetota bacterium]